MYLYLSLLKMIKIWPSDSWGFATRDLLYSKEHLDLKTEDLNFTLAGCGAGAGNLTWASQYLYLSHKAIVELNKIHENKI